MSIERMMASNHLILCHLLLLLPSSFPSIRAFRNEVKLFWQSLNALWLGLKANLGPFLLCDSFKPAFQFECDSCVLYLNSNVNNLSIILRIIRKHQDKQEEKGLKVIFQSQETPDTVYSTSSTVAAAAESLQSCPTPCDPTDGSHQAPPSLGFSRQEHWSGLPFPSPMHESEKWKWSRSVVSASSRPHGPQPTRLLRPWDFPGKSTGVGCHCLLWLVALKTLKTFLADCCS